MKAKSTKRPETAQVNKTKKDTKRAPSAKKARTIMSARPM